MLQTLDLDGPRTLPMESSGVTMGSMDSFLGAWTQDSSSTTSTRDWTWLESMQEDLGYRQRLYGQSVEVIDLFGQDASRLLLLKYRPHTSESPSPTLPYRECARLVAQHFSLNKTDLAKLFSISRPTLYSWISGEREPREESHRQRLAFLGRIASGLFRSSPRPLYHRFVYELMPEETTTIYECLQATSWDEPLLRRLFERAELLTAQRDEQLTPTPPSPRNVQEQNLQDNLMSLGGL